MEHIQLCHQIEDDMKTNTYTRLLMAMVCCLCAFCVAECSTNDMQNRNALAHYAKSGYLFWSTLRSTNEVLFVDRYLKLMNMPTSEMEIKKRSDFLKYKVQVFRDFAKSGTLFRETNAWLAVARVLSDIREVYCVASEEKNKPIKGGKDMSDVIVCADRKRVLSNISNEMWAAEKFVRSSLVDMINSLSEDVVFNRFLLISNISDRASFSLQERKALLDKTEMPEFKRSGDFGSQGNEGVRIQPL